MQSLQHKVGRWTVILALGLVTIGCGSGGMVSLPPAPASARGTVVDLESGAPLSGASVRSGGRTARSAADGSFVLGIEVGPASVSVSRSEYHTGTYTTDAIAGQEVDMGALTLSSEDGAPPPPPF